MKKLLVVLFLAGPLWFDAAGQSKSERAARLAQEKSAQIISDLDRQLAKSIQDKNDAARSAAQQLTALTDERDRLRAHLLTDEAIIRQKTAPNRAQPNIIAQGPVIAPPAVMKKIVETQGQTLEAIHGTALMAERNAESLNNLKDENKRMNESVGAMREGLKTANEKVATATAESASTGKSRDRLLIALGVAMMILIGSFTFRFHRATPKPE